jgi:hypothetical protein
MSQFEQKADLRHSDSRMFQMIKQACGEETSGSGAVF